MLLLWLAVVVAVVAVVAAVLAVVVAAVVAVVVAVVVAAVVVAVVTLLGMVVVLLHIDGDVWGGSGTKVDERVAAPAVDAADTAEVL